MRFEAVLFDMDGVIFDSERAVIECWKLVAPEAGLKNIEEFCHQALGINSAATYEIVSLQGQVVKSGVVSSSVSLSSLNAGVYMVRVAGKSVNMNQKILVK